MSLCMAFDENHNREVVLRAIGASAVNQAVKACVIARGMLASKGAFDLVVRPGFQNIMGEGGDEISAVTLSTTIR